jgi:hypothetical protein
MVNTKFNFLGFMIAHQRGKNLDKKDRNKSSLLAALVPSDNFTGVLTPIALVDKEVAKKENGELETENAELKQKIGAMDQFLINTVKDAPPLETDKQKGDFLVSFVRRVYPDLKVEELDRQDFYRKIDDDKLRTYLKKNLVA